MAEQRPSPTEEVRRLYEQAESNTAKAFEDLVSTPSFGEILARVTENTMGVIRISNSAFDLMVRNLRIAGRPDLARLGRQLARTEDKLEHVLQEVERLSDRLEALTEPQEDGKGKPRTGPARPGNGA